LVGPRRARAPRGDAGVDGAQASHRRPPCDGADVLSRRRPRRPPARSAARLPSRLSAFAGRARLELSVRARGRRGLLRRTGARGLLRRPRGAARLPRRCDPGSFLGFRSDVADVLRAADIVVLPSLDEGLPLAVLEAMACAKPVVATPVGGVPEAVVDEVTGILVPPSDSESLAAAMLRLLQDRD